MKFSGSQRRVYLLALALLVVAVALASAWSLWGKPDGSPGATTMPTQDVQSGRDAEPSQGSPEAEEAPADRQTTADSGTEAAAGGGGSRTSTIVYYQDNYGYLVPVMCSVPM